MKIAILHEMLIKLWGAEKVIESLLKIFPEADLYTLIYDEKKVGSVFPKEKITSVARPSQRIYNIFKNQRFCLPLMPKAVESLDFSDYDYVVSSSSWFAHWAITWKNTKLITYYHSPARYLWDWTNEYKKDIGYDKGIKWLLLDRLFLQLRKWDFAASKRSDISLANSNNTKWRIKKYFRKDATLLYPPVETSRFSQEINTKSNGERYYIILSALTEFKRIKVGIEGFNKYPSANLIIIWDGDHRETLEKSVTWKNIEFVWAKYANELVELVQNSEGLIFPGEEDFGIVPIEVMAAGKPVFAYRGWWLLETVLEWKTWEFFDNKDGQDFVERFKIFDENNVWKKYNPSACKTQAEKFSQQEFEKHIRKIIK